MNIYSSIRQLAKSVKSQNLFLAAKELSGIRLFKNLFDLSKLQEIYLSYLYIYNSINTDIVVEHISEEILTDEIYEDAYLLWKKKNRNKEEQKDNQKDLHLVPGRTINFKKEVK